MNHKGILILVVVQWRVHKMLRWAMIGMIEAILIIGPPVVVVAISWMVCAAKEVRCQLC